jgi:hypothetical protein
MVVPTNVTTSTITMDSWSIQYAHFTFIGPATIQSNSVCWYFWCDGSLPSMSANRIVAVTRDARGATHPTNDTSFSLGPDSLWDVDADSTPLMIAPKSGANGIIHK